MSPSWDATVTVFLADDHAVVRDGLRSLLEAEKDIQVIGDASNGRDAVHRVAEDQPDIAILDIAMPELNGIDATRQISEICPATRTIILSMHSNPEHIFRALHAGARGYLLKESAGAEVVHAVRAVHDGHRYLSQAISEIVLDDYVRQREAAEGIGPLAHLTPREREIVQLVVEGRSSAEIAESLCLSAKTVDTYRSRAMQKLQIHDLPSLVKFAIQHGLTSLE
jgi:DNA-binding NarL/FixJ family response regulator